MTKTEIFKTNKIESINKKTNIPSTNLNYENNTTNTDNNISISINQKENRIKLNISNNNEKNLVFPLTNSNTSNNNKINIKKTIFNSINNFGSTNKNNTGIANNYNNFINEKTEKDILKNSHLEDIHNDGKNIEIEALKNSKLNFFDHRKNNQINKTYNYNSSVDKNISHSKNSSLPKNNDISKEKDSNLNNLINNINKNTNLIQNNLTKLNIKPKNQKLDNLSKNANICNLFKIGINNNFSSSKNNLRKIPIVNNYKTNNLQPGKNLNSNTKYISNFNNIGGTIKKNPILGTNNKNLSFISSNDYTTNKNNINYSRNNNIINKIKFNSKINNLTEQSDIEQEESLSKTKDNFMKMKFSKFNNIQSGIIDLSNINNKIPYENNITSTDSINTNFYNNKFGKKLTNNIESYLSTNSNNKYPCTRSEFSVDSVNSKNKYLCNVSNYSSLNQKTISENTDNSRNTIVNNKNGNFKFKSINTFISNGSGITEKQMDKSSYINQSINISNILDISRNNSRSKSKASDKTTSVILNFNNYMGMKSDDSEQNLNFINFNKNRERDFSSESNNSSNIKNLNGAFNYNELKKKLQIKDLDATSNKNSNYNLSNNTIKEGNSINENLDYKNIDIKDDYESINHNVKLRSNNKSNNTSNNNLNNKKNISENNNRDFNLKRSLITNNNSNLEYLKNKIK